jgi:hypothetical protein
MHKTDMSGVSSFMCPEFPVCGVNAAFQVNLQTLNIMGHGIDLLLPFRAEVKERVELYI